MADRLIVCHLGQVAYRPTWEMQNEIQRFLVASKRAGRQADHVLLSVEHPPVYTLGKSGDENNLLASNQTLNSVGAEFVHIDRGGDITFHGPGQIVLYPLLDLERVFTDLGKYLRYLEQAVIDCLETYNIPGGRVDGLTGVWLAGDENTPERKICAMGIHCSRWVTKHGLALNVNTDLSFYQHIIPCGIDNKPVTSMSTELGKAIDIAEVRTELINQIEQQFDLAVTQLHGDEADEYLAEITEAPKET